MADVMHIGISAVMAYKAALTVTSQNIANTDTPFYSRRTVDLQQVANYGGVYVGDIKRITDQNTNSYVQLCGSNMNKWKTYSEQLNFFEPLLDNDDINVGKFITDSLGVLRNLQTDASSSNRQLYADSLISLVNQFNNINSQINSQLLQVNGSLQSEVQAANDLLSQLKSINLSIISSEGTIANDLLDDQERALQELSKYFNFTRVVYDNNTVDVVLSNGLSMLKDVPPYFLTTADDPQYPSRLNITATNGINVADTSNLISSGSLTGWKNFRDLGLIDIQQQLNRLALVFQDNLNSQNCLGVTADGVLGVNIFTDINTSGAMSSRIIANDNNTGSLTSTVTIDDVSALYASDYEMTIGSTGAYSLVRLNDSSVVKTGTITGVYPQSIVVDDGFTISLTAGTYPSGDRYVFSPTNNAIGNMAVANSNSASLGGLLALGWPVIAEPGTHSPLNPDGRITITDITDTSTSAFTTTPGTLVPPIRIEFSVSGGITEYSLYNANSSVLIEGPLTYTSGANIFPTTGGYDPGYRVTISGNNQQPGDIYNINYNSAAANDNRNTLKMAALYSDGSVLGNANQLVSFSVGYNLISSDLSYNANNAIRMQQSSKVAYDGALSNFDALSSVALEEETMNLAMYQVAYQAGAQILQTARSIFDIIASLAR